MTTTQKLKWNDLKIESVDAKMLVNSRDPGKEIAIRITYDNGSFITEPLKSMKRLLRENVVEPHFIFWIWGPTDIYYSYLNLLVYLLEDINLNQYCSNYGVSLINVLNNLWERYRDKPSEYIRQPTKEIHFNELKRFLLMFLESYEDTYLQFTNQKLFRTQLTEIPFFTRQDYLKIEQDKDKIDLYMLDTYPELWKNIHSLWYLSSSLTIFLQENRTKIPKKVIRNIFEITKKIIESKDFQKLKKIFICVATPSKPLTPILPNEKKISKIIFKNIANSKIKTTEKYCFFNGEHLNIKIENKVISYLIKLLIVLQNIEKIYKLFFKLNKRDAILAFILNQFDFSIDKNNKNSFNYPIYTIQKPITDLLSFLEKNKEYLMNPQIKLLSKLNEYRLIIRKFDDSVRKRIIKQKEFNRLFNRRLLPILKNPSLGVRLNPDDIRDKMKKLKKYQRDILFQLVTSGNLPSEPPIFIEYQGEYHIKKINTPLQIKDLFDFYTEDDILKKHEAFSKL